MKFASRHRVKALFAWVAIVFASVSHAGTPITYTEHGRSIFTLEAPDFWSVRTGGFREIAPPGSDEVRQVSRVIGLQPVTDDALWVGFISPEGVATFAQAEAYLVDIGPFLVKNAELEKSTSRRIGGMPARTFSGTGTRDGKGVSFTAVIYDLPNGRVAIAIAILESGVDPEFVGEINTVLTSVRAIR